MTTKHSPLAVLKAQADKIAATLKAAERGGKVDPRFSAGLAAAKLRPTFNVAVVMDDKVIRIDIPWATIRDTEEAGISEFILREMRESRSH